MTTDRQGVADRVPEGARFVLRTAGLATAGDRVLLHRADGDDFWALPGGRIEWGETAATALAREIDEELGLRVDVGDLVFVVESRFTYRGTPFHEVGLYHRMAIEPWTGTRWGAEPHGLLEFRWVPVPELGAYDVRPSALLPHLFAADRGVLHLTILGT